ELGVWRRVLDPNTGNPTGMCKLVEMRTLWDVFGDLQKIIEVETCKKCCFTRPCRDWGRPTYHKRQDGGRCGGGFDWFIDEYFHGPDRLDRNGGERVPKDWRWLACYPVTGGSEGHYVHVEFASEVEEVSAWLPDAKDWSTPAKVRLSRHGNDSLWK